MKVFAIATAAAAIVTIVTTYVSQRTIAKKDEEIEKLRWDIKEAEAWSSAYKDVLDENGIRYC